MSSAVQLGQDWTHNDDLDTISIAIVGLEKHSRPNRVRSTLTVSNGPPGLQVEFWGFFIVFPPPLINLAA